MSEIKQVIVVRHDLHMRMGKACAQASHASMEWLRLALLEDPRAALTLIEKEWLTGDHKKIVLRANSEAELRELYEKANSAGVVARLVTDDGLTEFKQPTLTALAIGPDYATDIDPLTRHLKLL